MNKALMALLLPAMICAAQADELISEAEARLPGGQQKVLVTRSITRGPGIQLVSPGADHTAVRSPFDLRVEFVARGSAKIDPDSVKIVYDRTPPVNLIERVRAGVSSTGIVLTGAQAPPGKHTIVVSVGDNEGRSTTRAFEITVAQ